MPKAGSKSATTTAKISKSKVKKIKKQQKMSYDSLREKVDGDFNTLFSSSSPDAAKVVNGKIVQPKKLAPSSKTKKKTQTIDEDLLSQIESMSTK